MGAKEVLKDWNKIECVKFAVWCARRVAHFSDDPRVKEALTSCETWLKCFSSENSSAARAAGGAARAAGGACRDAADAASNIAGNTGGYAAYSMASSSLAAYAASNAAFAAWSCDLLDNEIMAIAATYSLTAMEYAAMALAYDGYANRNFDCSISRQHLLDIYVSETLMREVSGIRS